MSDADDAQYNAVQRVFGPNKILMCFFHVMQWLYKMTKQLNLSREHIKIIFANVYDLHYAKDLDSYNASLISIKNNWVTIGQTNAAFEQFRIKMLRQWIDNRRWFKWQAFRSVSGTATTNNPLEQNHGPLKRILTLTGKTTILNLIHGVENSMLNVLRGSNYNVNVYQKFKNDSENAISC